MSPKAEVRDYLAVEQLFLAWIRMGIALMGFGFVVARFGLFLRQLEIIRGRAGSEAYGPSLWLGTALIAAGILIILSSLRDRDRLVLHLERGEVAEPPGRLAVLTAAFVVLIGVAMAIYLFLVPKLD